MHLNRDVIMKLINLVIVISVMTLLSSCSRNYENVTDYSLCYKAAKFGDNRGGARFKEIKDRGLNCKKYATRIDDQMDAERLAKASRSSSGSVFDDDYDKAYDNLQRSLDPNSASNRLERLERDLRFNCIQGGGVAVGNTCLK